MNLNRLLVPHSDQLTIHLQNGGKKVVVAEQIFDLASTFDGNEARWSDAFSKMKSDAATYERLKEIYVQLTKLICATGFWDIGWMNIPLTPNAEGLVLVDLNDMFDYTVTPQGHTYSDHILDGVKALLEYAHPEFYQVIISTAMHQLKKSQAEVLSKLELRNVGGQYKFFRKSYDIKDIYRRVKI